MDRANPKGGESIEFADPDATTSSYSVASLMLLMTLVSLLFGLITLQPCIGVPLALFCEIAWLTVTDIVGRRAARGLHTPFRGKVRMFTVWFNIVAIFFALVGLAVASPLLALSFVNWSVDDGPVLLRPDALLTIGLLLPPLALFCAARLAQYAARERQHSFDVPMKLAGTTQLRINAD